MKENHATIRADRLNRPIETLFAGRLSSAVLVVGGDIPGDVAGLAVRIGRTEDPDTHQPRQDYTAVAARQADGTFRCYLSPFLFPDASGDLKYHVVGTDEEGNPRWLGTGALVVLECPTDGSADAPAIIPADTYVRNPVTGLYHKLTAEVNEHGEVTVAVEEEGIER